MPRNSVHDRESSLVARKNGRQCLHAGLGPAQAQVANDSIPTLGSLKSKAGNAMAETQEEYGQNTKPARRESKIGSRHEEQEVGATAGVRDWLGEPGASAAE